jgi:hypothetical protein
VGMGVGMGVVMGIVAEDVYSSFDEIYDIPMSVLYVEQSCS